MKYKKKLTVAALAAGALAYLGIPDRYPVYPASDHYDPASGLFRNHQPQGKVRNVASAMWRMAVDGQSLHPQRPIPTAKPDWMLFQTASARKRFVWFGHSTLMMRIGGQTVITDPVFGESVSPIPGMMNRFQPPPAPFEALPPIDVVLISHNHYDHLEEATIKKMATQHQHFIVPIGVGFLLQKWGIAPERITELDWWQSTERGGIRYTAVPARHDSARSITDRFKTLWTSWVIEQDGEKIFFSADPAYGRHYPAIGAHFGGFDLAFIENGQYNERWPDNHLFPEQTAQAGADLRAKRFMPIHWGAYAMALHSWNDPVKRSVPAARKLGIRTLTPLQGQVFDADSETQDWFMQD